MGAWEIDGHPRSSSQISLPSRTNPDAENSGSDESAGPVNDGRMSRAMQNTQSVGSAATGPLATGRNLANQQGPSIHRDRRALALAPDLPLTQFESGAQLAEPSNDDEPLDLKKYLRILIKHRWLIIGVAAIATCLGLAYTLLQTPVYRGSATIEIRREVENLNGIAGLEGADSGAAGEFYQTQYELLKSRALAERIVAKLRLAEQADFLRVRKSPLSRITGFVLGSGEAEAVNIAANQVRAVGLVMAGLSVQPVRSSRIVRVSYDSPSPRYAQEVANGAVTAFVEMNLERSYAASSHARKFLEERLQDLKLKLEESERKLVDYAEEKDILTTGDDRTLTITNLEDANSALSAASKERLKQELTWNQIKDAKQLPQAFETDAVAKLRSKRADLMILYQDKLKLFKPGYPDMVQLRAQITELDNQIDREVARIKESLQLQYAAAVEEQKSLEQQVAELKREVSDYQERSIDYTILKREVDTNRSLYEGLLQRYKELSVAGGGGNPSNISVLDEALRPGAPYKPNLKLNLSFALFFGIMAGGLAAFAREFIDDSFSTPEEVEQGLGLPLLGVIPDVDDADLVDAMEDLRSPINEACRSLRTALQFSTSGGVPKTLMVTSSRPAEGKSFTAFSIARHFALLGMQVLLIDADLRKPSLHKRLGCIGHRGLSNCLVGNATPPEVLQRTDYPNLEFMPAGALPPDPTELLASSRMASLLALASEKYDLVVIDSAPVGGMADAPVLSNFADGCLLVIHAHKAPRTGVTNALKRLHFARADVLGAVLNRFDAKLSGYSASYGYGYGYGADEYYGYGGDAQAEELAGSETEALVDQTKDA